MLVFSFTFDLPCRGLYEYNTTKAREKTSITLAGFEPAIPKNPAVQPVESLYAHIPIANQNFGSNTLRPLFPKSVRTSSVH